MREGMRKVGRRNTRIEGGRSLLYNHMLWESYIAKKVLLCLTLPGFSCFHHVTAHNTMSLPCKIGESETQILWMAKYSGTVNTISVEFTSSPCCDSTAADNDCYLRSFNRELA